jgi:hypothetical protein
MFSECLVFFSSLKYHSFELNSIHLLLNVVELTHILWVLFHFKSNGYVSTEQRTAGNIENNDAPAFCDPKDILKLKASSKGRPVDLQLSEDLF